MVANSPCRISICSVVHIGDGKKNLVVILFIGEPDNVWTGFIQGGIIFQNGSKSLVIFDVKARSWCG